MLHHIAVALHASSSSGYEHLQLQLVNAHEGLVSEPGLYIHVWVMRVGVSAGVQRYSKVTGRSKEACQR